MAGNPFKKALVSESRLRMALCGPAGSGKTYTALRVATGLLESFREAGSPLGNGRIALIDTEHGSAAKYARYFDFDSVELANFHPDLYRSLMKDAERAGYPVIIIDSLSHAWAGTGGLLERHNQETEKSRSKNSWTAWAKVTPIQNQLIDSILQSNCHVIATMRSKTEWLPGKDAEGKFTVEKIGLAPVQRQDTDYEFDLFGTMNQDHVFIIDKTRFRELDGAVIPKPSEEFGGSLHTFLCGDETATPWVPPASVKQSLSSEIIDKINTLCATIKMPEDAYAKMLSTRGVERLEDLTEGQGQEIVTKLRAIKEKQAINEAAEAVKAVEPAPPSAVESKSTPQATLPSNWLEITQSWPQSVRDYLVKFTEEKIIVEQLSESQAEAEAFEIVYGMVKTGHFNQPSGNGEPASADASEIVNENISKLEKKPKKQKKGA